MKQVSRPRTPRHDIPQVFFAIRRITTDGKINVWAGAAPGFSGLYQVNVMVPAGIAPSQQAPLVLSQGGRASATVTIPIQ